MRAPLLISGFPLHFETGDKSILFSYVCTPIVKQYARFNFRGTRQILLGWGGDGKNPFAEVKWEC